MLELRAQAFVVVDSDGRERARLSCDEAARSVLYLDQLAVASLSSTQRSAIVFGCAPHVPRSQLRTARATVDMAQAAALLGCSTAHVY